MLWPIYDITSKYSNVYPTLEPCNIAMLQLTYRITCKYSNENPSLEPCNVAMLWLTYRMTSQYSNAHPALEPCNVAIQRRMLDAKAAYQTPHSCAHWNTIIFDTMIQHLLYKYSCKALFCERAVCKCMSCFARIQVSTQSRSVLLFFKIKSNIFWIIWSRIYFLR